MRNYLQPLIPRITARALLQFREKAILPRLVNNSLTAEAGRRGDRIDILVKSNLQVKDVVPLTYHIGPSIARPETVSIKLNKWKKVTFFLTDAELMQVEAEEQFIPYHMNEAVSALANEINRSIIDVATTAPTSIGTYGTTPFAPPASGQPPTGTQGILPALECRKMLNKKLAPKAGRIGLIDFDAEANALALPQFMDAGKIGSDSVPLEGEIGRKFGIDWYSMDEVGKTTDQEAFPKLTAPAEQGATRIEVVHEARPGLTQLKNGDQFTFANHPRHRYILTETEIKDEDNRYC